MTAPSSTQILTAIPTDYGPDPSTPFTRALTLLARITHGIGCTWGDFRGRGKKVKTLP